MLIDACIALAMAHSVLADGEFQPEPPRTSSAGFGSTAYYMVDGKSVDYPTYLAAKEREDAFHESRGEAPVDRGATFT